MRFVVVIGLSVLAGAVAAGLTWFGWEFAQNLKATIRDAGRTRHLPKEAEEEAKSNPPSPKA